MDWGTVLDVWLPFFGTVIGTFGGIMASSKLSNYRIEQLEKKVDKHNSVVERTFRIEGEISTIENEISDIKDDIRSLKST